MLTIDGIPEPAYRAFELLHRLGDHSFVVEGTHPTVDAWVARRGDTVTVLVTNSTLPRHPLEREWVAITLRDVTAVRSALVERIDDDHANARRAWVAMGQPDRPSPTEVAAPEAASALRAEAVAFRPSGDVTVVELDVPPQGTALLMIELA